MNAETCGEIRDNPANPFGPVACYKPAGHQDEYHMARIPGSEDSIFWSRAETAHDERKEA